MWLVFSRIPSLPRRPASRSHARSSACVLRVFASSRLRVAFRRDLRSLRALSGGLYRSVTVVASSTTRGRRNRRDLPARGTSTGIGSTPAARRCKLTTFCEICASSVAAARPPPGPGRDGDAQGFPAADRHHDLGMPRVGPERERCLLMHKPGQLRSQRDGTGRDAIQHERA